MIRADPTPRMAGPTSLESWVSDRLDGPTGPGSVLVHVGSSAFQAPGGGETQLVQTARHLEALGESVRPFCPWRDRIEQARILHLFGMSREGLALAEVARARGVPVVLSPICWYEARSLAALAGSRTRAALDLAKLSVKLAFPRWPSWRRRLLNLADRVLPNSEAEAGQLVRLFAIDRGRVRVVPNGVEPRFARAVGERISRNPAGPGDHVLYVGRIEPRKNVLGLIRATRALGLPLAVIGGPVPGHERYAGECRRAGGEAVRWLPRMGHDDPRLEAAYAGARVFALPSWFETPGLAALEAALAGCAVVVTPYGCTREYFGDRVRYARPDRPGEVRSAIRSAWEDGPDPGLSDEIHARFLWPEVARRTSEVYHELAG